MYLYETTCHIVSGMRTLGEQSYDKTMDIHLNRMGKENWELVSVQKAIQALSLDPLTTADLSEELLDSYASPREVFVFFWKKPVTPENT